MCRIRREKPIKRSMVLFKSPNFPSLPPSPMFYSLSPWRQLIQHNGMWLWVFLCLRVFWAPRGPSESRSSGPCGSLSTEHDTLTAVLDVCCGNVCLVLFFRVTHWLSTAISKPCLHPAFLTTRTEPGVSVGEAQLFGSRAWKILAGA